MPKLGWQFCNFLVFLKYALDQDTDGEESARLHLLLGEPTTQTILFFKELLLLLKKSVADSDPSRLKANRRLLLPVLASMATKDYDRELFCHSLFHGWYKSSSLANAKAISDEKHQKNWPVTEKTIAAVVQLAARMLNSELEYLPIKGEPITVLFGKDAVAIAQAPYAIPPDMDRWLALMTGNVLHTDPTKKQFFTHYLDKPLRLFDLVRNRNRFDQQSTPPWAKIGHEERCNWFMSGKYIFDGGGKYTFDGGGYIDLHLINCTKLDMSYSEFKGINFSYSIMTDCTFNGSSLSYVLFIGTSLHLCRFDDVCFEPMCEFFESWIGSGIRIPYIISTIIAAKKDVYYTIFTTYVTITGIEYLDYTGLLAQTIRGFLVFVLQHRNVTIAEMKEWFLFDKPNSEEEKKLHAFMETLRSYERPAVEREQGFPQPEIKPELMARLAPHLATTWKNPSPEGDTTGFAKG